MKTEYVVYSLHFVRPSATEQIRFNTEIEAIMWIEGQFKENNCCKTYYYLKVFSREEEIQSITS